MGRKIPGRKHRGIKDPEKQQAVRFAKIKDKINAPPENPDDQQFPKSLTRIIELKNKVKEGLFNKKKKKLNEDEKTTKRGNFNPEKPVPKFERKPGETDRQFKHRINLLCSEAVKEAHFEDKYRVDIIRNEEGEVEKVQKRPKDELEVLIKKIRKEKKGKKGKKSKNNEQQEKLTKSQKWARKKAEKKQKKLQNQREDFSSGPQREQFKFGEVAQAPPTLVTPKRVPKLDGAPRPGKKQLLLKSMMFPNENGVVKKTIDKKGKRKELPNALRRQLDKQQKEIIQAYKNLKSKKNKSTTNTC